MYRVNCLCKYNIVHVSHYRIECPSYRISFVECVECYDQVEWGWDEFMSKPSNPILHLLLFILSHIYACLYHIVIVVVKMKLYYECNMLRLGGMSLW